MSGGSYDYACYSMESGDLDKAIRECDRAVVDFDRLSALPIEVNERPNGKYAPRPTTAEERFLTEAGLGLLRRQLVAFRDNVARLSEQARELAKLYHCLEWIASGDYGDAELQEFARNYAKSRLG